jgi:hypothetical protein
MATCDNSISEERTIAIFTARVSWKWQQFIHPEAAKNVLVAPWPQYILPFVVISNEGRYDVSYMYHTWEIWVQVTYNIYV